MPAKNSIKLYSENSYYHLYNRGVEKRSIFMDKQDYNVFLHYLQEYLLPKDEKELREMLSDPRLPYQERDRILKLLRLNNFNDEIKLIAYCLMPNHFHFLVQQNSSNSIHKFISSLGTRYSMYFNNKYKRVGSLYQGVYKAVMVKTDEQLLYLTRYIHKQALALQGETLEPEAIHRADGQPCSYPEYVGQRKTDWVHPEEVLSFFSKTNPKLSYESFVKQQEDFIVINKLTLDEDI